MYTVDMLLNIVTASTEHYNTSSSMLLSGRFSSCSDTVLHPYFILRPLRVQMLVTDFSIPRRVLQLKLKDRD